MANLKILASFRPPARLSLLGPLTLLLFGEDALGVHSGWLLGGDVTAGITCYGAYLRKFHL
jgi:hypothetical protein